MAERGSMRFHSSILNVNCVFVTHNLNTFILSTSKLRYHTLYLHAYVRIWTLESLIKHTCNWNKISIYTHHSFQLNSVTHLLTSWLVVGPCHDGSGPRPPCMLHFSIREVVLANVLWKPNTIANNKRVIPDYASTITQCWVYATASEIGLTPSPRVADSPPAHTWHWLSHTAGSSLQPSENSSEFPSYHQQASFEFVGDVNVVHQLQDISLTLLCRSTYWPNISNLYSNPFLVTLMQYSFRDIRNTSSVLICLSHTPLHSRDDSIRRVR